MKCVLEIFGEKEAFFTVGGNASKSGLIDVLEMQPKYLLIDEIEHLKPEYQTMCEPLLDCVWKIYEACYEDAFPEPLLHHWNFKYNEGYKKFIELQKSTSISNPLVKLEQSSPLFTHSGNIKLVALATVIGDICYLESLQTLMFCWHVTRLNFCDNESTILQ